MKLIETYNGVTFIQNNDTFIFIKTNNENEDKIIHDKYFISRKYRLFKEIRLIQKYSERKTEIFNPKTQLFDLVFKNYSPAIENYKLPSHLLMQNFDSPKNQIDLFVDYKFKKSFYFYDAEVGFKFYDNLIIKLPHFLEDLTHLTCYTLDNNKEPVWHFKVPKGFIIAPNIQIVEDVIFFEAHKDHYNYMNFYGVSIYTGKIVWEINKTPDSKEVLIIWANINPKDNLAYGYSADLYQVFDPVKGKILIEKDMSTYWKKTKGIDPMPDRAYIANNRLWFVGTNNEKPAFGAINIQTHELEFVQELPKETGILVKILYHNNKIYINDDEGHLYVFEDKDNNTTT